MITLTQYWMGRNVSNALELTPDIQREAAFTVILVNKILERMQQAKVPLELSPDTKSLVASGWRPPSVNARTPNAAVRSLHMKGQAVDLYDPDGALDEWLFSEQDGALRELGLWLEHPAATKNWAHLQTLPPRSGRRVFYP
jgi:hypothetical protein